MAVPSAPDAWARYVDDLLLGRYGKRRSAVTVADYRFPLFDFWALVAPIPWNRIGVADYRRYLDRPARVGPGGRGRLAPNSRALYSSAILGFYRWATVRRLLARNPLEGVRAEPKVEPPARGLDLRQVGDLFARAARDPRTHLAVALGFFALLRAGEIARLRIQDVDLRAGQLLVRGKGGYLDSVPIHHDLRPMLAGTLDGRARTEPVIGHATRPGQPVTSRTVSRIIAAPMRELGWSESAHVLRHSAAYLLLEETGNLYAVSRLLRHRRLSSTERYLRRADRQLAAYLGQLADPRVPDPTDPWRLP